MKKYLLFIFLIFLLGCEGDKMKHKDVEIVTEDNLKISGDLYEGGEKGIILLHQYTATKKIWRDFAEKMQENGYSVLAIDFRGHGLSDLDYDDFSEKDFNNMIYDVKAAKEFLKKDEIIIVGASIGANIALKFANEVDGVVLLSPGLNYKGIDIEEDASLVNKPVLIVVHDKDKYAYESSMKLENLIKNGELKTYKGNKHGTYILDDETSEYVIRWVDNVLKL